MILRWFFSPRASCAAWNARGFRYRRSSSIEMFLDGSGANARELVRVLFVREQVRPEYDLVPPSVIDLEEGLGWPCVAAESSRYRSKSVFASS